MIPCLSGYIPVAIVEWFGKVLVGKVGIKDSELMPFFINAGRWSALPEELDDEQKTL